MFIRKTSKKKEPIVEVFPSPIVPNPAQGIHSNPSNLGRGLVRLAMVQKKRATGGAKNQS